MNNIETMKLALEALDTIYATLSPETMLAKDLKRRADALCQAIEQAEQPSTGNVLMDAHNAMVAKKQQAEQAQPVGEVLDERGEVDWISFVPPAGTLLYTAPPKEEQAQPVAWTAGFYAGHCVIRATDPAAILPIGVALYTAPPQRQPLTEEEILDCWKQAYEPGRREHDNATRMARAIEAAHGIKGNT